MPKVRPVDNACKKGLQSLLSALGREAAAEFQAGSVPSFALDSFPAGVNLVIHLRHLILTRNKL